MIGTRQRWQLPVKESNLTNHVWIHPRAKFHFFTDKNMSLCEKYMQVWYLCETYPHEQDWKTLEDEVFCKKCLSILRKSN